MEMGDPTSPHRHQAIVVALTAELERQAQAGASRIDVEALAGAVETAIDPAPPLSEGRSPDELNATNDD
ncbi:MAG: hypothetical protein KIT02_14230 [Devosia sp.]|uniref:hypothetical protein n=1 Tax=Devosia sp. TaxID=1871048 RepID=UPI0024CCBFDB|nr:hypothetical protein [Devosia sp.]UYN99072.1 MAG: hypothetical protein KIT02_14230 [Devosia sp.]